MTVHEGALGSVDQHSLGKDGPLCCECMLVQQQRYTPGKINIEPENHWVIDQSSLPKSSKGPFSGSMLIFPGVILHGI